MPKFKLLSWDKLGHFVFYFTLTILLIGGFKSFFATKRIANSFLLLCFIVASLYGMSLEFVQMYYPNRSFDYADMLANGMGAAAALAVFKIYQRTYLKL